MKQEASIKPIIVVLGMHRSGASVMARAHQVLGVDLRDQLMPPVKGNNETGFWEYLEISDFDDALLERVGSGWDRLTLLDEKKQNHRFVEQRKAVQYVACHQGDAGFQ